ncbi:hypothetical protein GJAV_G00115710 [Gymnothorax javanicus]|nr:hypothetical protein GJAV_G00115710 [Gymnothorax javanicus]
MGISKLSDLIRSEAPSAISFKEISDYSGKTIAVDASIVLHQFCAAVPRVFNRNGVHLSPLTGLFFRTLCFLEHDIKPVFVFDGCPPEQKKSVLEKRALAAGWSSSNCSGSVSTRIQDCQSLLMRLGVPFLQAPGDAEAYCAQLMKEGKVEGHGCIWDEIMEYSLSKILAELQLTYEQFVDLCILLGCDYCDKIHGLGPKRALHLIRKHKTIESVVLHIDRKTHPVPLEWKYRDARELFHQVAKANQPDLVWQEPDEQELVNFLCNEKHVNEERVRGRMEKFRKTVRERKEGAESNTDEKGKQTNIKDFFRVTRKRQAADTVEASRGKRIKP